MLVHISDGYFVDKNSIVSISPKINEDVILITLTTGNFFIPYSLLDSLIEVLKSCES